MAQYEIVLPETKPETEWVRLQGALTMRLDRWATGRGEVGPEWRFRVAPRGEVAVEILSPDDRRADVDDKIDVYLRAGSSLVIVVDPQQRAVELHDRDATGRLDETGAIEHWALPEFSYPVSELFAVLRRSR
jgi:Uma2 family endonuclease